MGWLGELAKKIRPQTVNEIKYREELPVSTTPLGTLEYENDPRHGDVVQGSVRGEKEWEYSLTDELSVKGKIDQFGDAEVFIKKGGKTKILSKLPRIVVGTPTSRLSPLGDTSYSIHRTVACGGVLRLHVFHNSELEYVAPEKDVFLVKTRTSAYGTVVAWGGHPQVIEPVEKNTRVLYYKGDILNEEQFDYFPGTQQVVVRKSNHSVSNCPR